MNTCELLASATLKSKNYIESITNSNVKADFKKMSSLFDRGIFVAKSFENSQLDILNFDWHSLERDRNWWWQLQALPFLNWFVNSFNIQTVEQKQYYFSKCLDAIQCWIENSKANIKSPLVWHDHAAAFRVRNIVNWLLFCSISGLDVRAKRAEPLAYLIQEHLDWLYDDKHYSKHTNHGFDQSMIALTIGLMFDCDRYEKHRVLNRKRLKDEIEFAFTSEGVHKENSPGYQKVMLMRLKQLRSLSPLGEKEISELAESYIEKAEGFLAAITLPNGYLPMIGDTRNEDKGVEDDIPAEGYIVQDYSRSGYIIVKGTMGNGSVFCLIVKNCHDSNYHRHDDDLMMYLYVDGVIVVGDGGLGHHQEHEPKRKYLRSVYAHSMPIVNLDFIRDRAKLNDFPSLSYDSDNKIIHGISNGFGVNVSREIVLSEILDGVITVRDRCDEQPVQSNWILGSDKISISQSGVIVDFPSFSLNFSNNINIPKSILSGWNVGCLKLSSIESKDFGRFVDSNRVVFGGSSNIVEIELMIKPFGGDKC